MIFLIFDFRKLSKNRKIFSKNSITRHYKKPNITRKIAYCSRTSYLKKFFETEIFSRNFIFLVRKKEIIPAEKNVDATTMCNIHFPQNKTFPKMMRNPVPKAKNDIPYQKNRIKGIVISIF